MQLSRHFFEYKPKQGAIALSIGNFDGLHLGHQDMLTRLVELAKVQQVPSMVLSFSPSPQAYFASLRKQSPPFHLASVRQKIESIRALGVDILCLPRFNAAIANMSADQFIHHLSHQWGVKHLVLGEDFRFGKGRSGDVHTLEKAQNDHSFQLHVHQNVCLPSGLRYSSTAVRTALLNADFSAAKQLLGRDYAIKGHVIRGHRLGRTLGFPTLNIRPPEPSPLSGIYVVEAWFGNIPHQGVASLGKRPTVNALQTSLLEVFVLDFASECYGEIVEVRFLKKLRDEMRFDSLTDLTAQMQLDLAQTKEFFAKQ